VRIDLPDGQWAELRDVAGLKAGDKVAVQRAVKFTQAPDGKPLEVNAGMSEDMQVALLAQVITSWSYEAPVTEDAILDLPVGVYNVLAEATTDHIEVMRVVPNRRTPSA
jgi:hypothetical protein